MLESPRRRSWACLCRLLRWCFCWFVGFPVLLFAFDYSQSFLLLFVLDRSLDCSQSLRWVFWLPFFHLSFDFCFNVWVFDVLLVSALACLSTIWPSTDMCFSVQLVVIESRGMLCFTWKQYLMYTILFWWNLSSARYLQLSSSYFFSQHVRWPDVFVSFVIVLEVNESMCDRRFAGHSILAFSIVIPISDIDSFRSCMTSGSDVSLWNPVITALPWFRSSCAHLGSSFLFSYFSSMSRIFFSMFVIISLICLYLSSPSSFIFTMVEFIPWICVPTESEIFCRNFSIFSSFFSSELSSASIISFFFKEQRIFTWSRQFAFTHFIQLLFYLYLLLIPVCPLTRSFPFLPAVSGTSQS